MGSFDFTQKNDNITISSHYIRADMQHHQCVIESLRVYQHMVPPIVFTERNDHGNKDSRGSHDETSKIVHIQSRRCLVLCG